MPDADPPADPLAERLVASELLHRGRYLEFRVDTVERIDGRRARRDVAVHPGAVAIVALDPEGRVLLVRQYRHPAGRSLLEIPAGTLDRDPGTGATEDPDEAARRELEEETGYRARHWERLTDFWTAPGFATERMFLYLATDLALAGPDRLDPDEDELLELVRLPWRDAVAAAERGEIGDAKSLVGILWLARDGGEPGGGAGGGAGGPSGPSGPPARRSDEARPPGPHVTRAGYSPARRRSAPR